MNPKLSNQMVILLLVGRSVVTILLLSAVLSKPIEKALFACVSIGALWFVVEGAINLWQEHQDAMARKLRDDELKRQRAEDARRRFEAKQREQQSDADATYMDLDLDDPAVSNARIPLDALRTKGAQEIAQDTDGSGKIAPTSGAGAMSASELDMALFTMDAEASTSRQRRA